MMRGRSPLAEVGAAEVHLDPLFAVSAGETARRDVRGAPIAFVARTLASVVIERTFQHLVSSINKVLWRA